MIRGGVRQSIAKRVTGHRSGSMFQRYDVASMDDKLEALRKARIYAAERVAISQNLAAFPPRLTHILAHVTKNRRVS